MFWGLIMEPHRRYTQKVKKAFHISMAALDLSTSSTEPAQVMCGFEGRNYLLCTLKKPDVLQCPLNLNFDVGSEVSFAANGRCHIHLTGYLNEDFTDLEEEEVDEEEEEEKEGVFKTSTKRTKSVENGPPKKKSKHTVPSSSQDQDEDEDSDDSDYLNNLLGKSLDDDEEDSDASVEEEEEDGEEEEEEDLDDEEEGEEEEESSLSEGQGDEEVFTTKLKVNGLSTPKAGQNESQKKKKEKKNKEKQAEEMKKVPQHKNEQKKEVKILNRDSQTPKKKSLQGGVMIEDIKEGNGAPARNGKFVNVFYEGRLKQNNKMFDSTTKGAGFSFRLGSGEVIKGWDIGVAGMKVGGKRRIMCPPAMAYGQKGSPPAIPPNSTLVFEVELRKVN